MIAGTNHISPRPFSIGISGGLSFDAIADGNQNSGTIVVQQGDTFNIQYFLDRLSASAAATVTLAGDATDQLSGFSTVNYAENSTYQSSTSQTVTVDALAEPGDHTLEVVCTAGAFSVTRTFTLTVQSEFSSEFSSEFN